MKLLINCHTLTVSLCKFGMDKWFNPALYDGCNYLSMLCLMLSHVNKPDPTARVVCMPLTWWRHQMETFSALLALCARNSPVPVNSPHKGQWCGALMFSLICARINDWVNNREAGDLRRHRGHYDVNVMKYTVFRLCCPTKQICANHSVNITTIIKVIS